MPYNFDALAEGYYSKYDPQFSDDDDRVICEKCGDSVDVYDAEEIDGHWYCRECIEQYDIRPEEDEEDV